MPIEREDDEFELDDLDLSGLTVTVMRDTVAIPETGASRISACLASCSCSIVPDEPML
ncbi:thiazolylpeptide-type bacteriocin [Micromonospora sp. DSM 115977]|uniref:Thiazolylpeptide-type bacteriocin n=1 Tax=Micromonospora reichwaldensis TaxID=3075516 RepID=A0ABU2WV48_9ACTN|nr:thiazolylpeptide-type bacteriocin [Micromonospora sp. DSM 115977]MDT0529114.1 thiazolylpeptide-type bacteriocin [Micromonospora sp. DSM 115977]